MEDEFYNLIVKGNDVKTYVRIFQELAILSPNMVPNNKKLMEVFIGGLPRSIKGNVTGSKPQTLEEAINIAQRDVPYITQDLTQSGVESATRQVIRPRIAKNKGPATETPVARAPYRLAPSEMQELSNQHQELADPSKQYTRRTRIAQSSVLPLVADMPASPLGDDSQGEACPIVSGLEAR
nr:reverse transcriptase domain-containing protein [Tanacetum cinerariifolium]